MLHLQARSSPARREQQAEATFGVRIERLNQELSAKTRTIQELSRSVDRLQKEKKNAMTITIRPPGTQKPRTETREQPGAAQTRSCSPPAAEETFPAARYQKSYKPTVFAGATSSHQQHGAPSPTCENLKLCSPLPHLAVDSHISDVLQENEALKQRLKLLELRSNQEKEALKVEVAQAREELLRYDSLCFMSWSQPC